MKSLDMMKHQILKKSYEIQQNRSSAGAISSYFKSATIMEKNGKLQKKIS